MMNFGKKLILSTVILSSSVIIAEETTRRARWYKSIMNFFSRSEEKTKAKRSLKIHNDIPDFELVHPGYEEVYNCVDVIINDQELKPGELRSTLLPGNTCRITLIAPVCAFEQFLKPTGLFKFLMKYATIHLTFDYQIEEDEDEIELTDVLLKKYELWEQYMPSIEHISVNPFSLKVHIILSDAEFDVSLSAQ